MSDIVLFFAPGTCARVPMTALEEAGVEFESRVVAFAVDETRSAEFRELNPAGKVPILVLDGTPLAENVAIALLLNERFPDAALLPPMPDAMARARVTSELAYCASVLHPLVTRLRLPHYFCSLPEARDDVWSLAAKGIAPHFDHVDARLSKAPWWCGESWSMLDSYVGWVWFRVTGAGLDPAPWPHLADHQRRLSERPAVTRALAREELGQAELVKRDLAFSFEPTASVS